jgi:hypothetical protein
MTTPGIAPRKRGRPSKGDRVGTHVALPVDLRADIEAMAERDGLPMGAVITRLVARDRSDPGEVNSFQCPVVLRRRQDRISASVVASCWSA